VAGGEQQLYKEALLKSTLILYLSFTLFPAFKQFENRRVACFSFPKTKITKILADCR
jgi:hypothetical protein